MENKFKKGLILGGLLAVGAALGFAMSKEGKKLTGDLQDDLKTLSQNLRKNLNRLQDVTKESFDKLVATVVEEYSKTKEMTIDAKKTLENELRAMWDEMENEYRNDNM